MHRKLGAVLFLLFGLVACRSARPSAAATPIETATPTTSATPSPSPATPVPEPRFDAAKGICQPEPASSLPGNFQVSAPRGDPGPDGRTVTHPYVTPGKVVQVGLRDKNGYSDGPAGPVAMRARVIAPDGTSTTAGGQLVSDQFLYLNYPSDFGGAPKQYPSGVYTVLWSQASNGGFIACDGFWAG
jgi:hypothetical protein